MIKLESKEGTLYDVLPEYLEISSLIKSMLEDDINTDIIIPLINISDYYLKDVILYMSYYHKDPMNKIPEGIDKLEKYVQDFYVNFINKYDLNSLYILLDIANFLDIKPLMDLAINQFIIILIENGDCINKLKTLLKIEDMTDESEKILRNKYIKEYNPELYS